jgi:hypothetical protein
MLTHMYTQTGMRVSLFDENHLNEKTLLIAKTIDADNAHHYDRHVKMRPCLRHIINCLYFGRPRQAAGRAQVH